MKLKVLIMTAFIATTIILLNSCKKDSDYLKSEAILEWQGEYDVDGCGFFVIIESKSYKPENESIISDDFKVDSSNLTNVIVEYQLSENPIIKSCGDAPEAFTFDAIKLISIKKK